MQKCCTLLQPATRKAFRRLILFPAFILSVANISLAQNTKIDSLLAVLNHSEEDTNKVNTLNALGWELISKGSYEDAKKHIIDAKNLAEKMNYEKGIAHAYSNLGLVYYYNGNYSEAMKSQLQSLKMQEAIGDSESIAHAYNCIGLIYKQEGNYPEAIKIFLMASKIYEQLNLDKNRIAAVYNNMSSIYGIQKNYHEALNMLFQVLAIHQQLGDKPKIAKTYTNIGTIYYEQGNYDLALQNTFRGMEIRKEIGDTIKIAFNYNNIGEIYFKMGNYEEALKNYLHALRIWEKNGDKLRIATASIGVGTAFTKQKKYNDAKKYLLEALQISKDVGAKDELQDCYSNLAALAEATGDYKNAYQYHKLFSEVKDSMLNESNNKAIAEMKTKYETEKKEKEIELLNSKLETRNLKVSAQRAAIRYLIGGFAALIIFALIYFRLYNKKRKITFHRQLLETELKALRSQMNPHFTFNVLNSIQYYVRANDMKSAELYLTKFSRLIRMILDQSRNSYISLQQEITMLKLYLELEQMLFEKKFKYSIEMDKSLDTGSVQIPGMLIQPIVENSIKHGLEYKEGEARIDISFLSHNSTLLCSITDNGIGREASETRKAGKRSEGLRTPSEEGEKVGGEPFHSSAATQIIKERMEALSSLYNIQLSYKTEDLFDNEGKSTGTRVSIELPIKN